MPAAKRKMARRKNCRPDTDFKTCFIARLVNGLHRPPAPAGCGVAAHRKLAGVDDLYTARAANRHAAPAGCGVVANRKLAGVDDLYTAANQQPAPADCGVVAHRKLAGVDMKAPAIPLPLRGGLSCLKPQAGCV